MPKKSDKAVFLPVDDDLRSEAKSVIRSARHGALALLDDDQSPIAVRVGIATDTNGWPVFPVSALSGRVEAMTRDCRTSLLLGDPGAGDPLAHPRVSLKGQVRLQDGEVHERARRRYLARHPSAATYIDFDDFSLWRLEPERVSFIAGFGRACQMSGDDVTTSCADWDAWHAMEAGAVEHMNDDHRDATQLYATVLLGADDGDWIITGLDPDGVDIALGDLHRRLNYDEALEDAAALRPKLVDLVREARSASS
ncbi:MAG: DUF2470 domain-containing protein [Pseudomonadota bacterium]